ncbi:MAG: hypothetical protein Q8O19_01440, partial [Rectinemataceae bacterium]|nr:hypothetical protein [Rectinemataceae bacterium]
MTAEFRGQARTDSFDRAFVGPEHVFAKLVQIGRSVSTKYFIESDHDRQLLETTGAESHPGLER